MTQVIVLEHFVQQSSGIGIVLVFLNPVRKCFTISWYWWVIDSNVCVSASGADQQVELS